MKIRRAEISLLLQDLGNKQAPSYYYELKLNYVIVPAPSLPNILMAAT